MENPNELDREDPQGFKRGFILKTIGGSCSPTRYQQSDSVSGIRNVLKNAWSFGVSSVILLGL